MHGADVCLHALFTPVPQFLPAKIIQIDNRIEWIEKYHKNQKWDTARHSRKKRVKVLKLANPEGVRSWSLKSENDFIGLLVKFRGATWSISASDLDTS